MAQSAAEKRVVFRKLHESGCFVLPNPWDLGSARLLQSLGFKALASTSSGAAWSAGRPDGGFGLQRTLDHLKSLAEAVDLPLNADFEGGFAEAPAEVAVNVALAMDAGVAGLSIEDRASPSAGAPLFPKTLAVERIRAARTAMDKVDAQAVLVGRCEAFLVGAEDLNEVIDRLAAYADAGADCLYAPGLRKREDIAAVVSALAPKPVNVLMVDPELSAAELAGLGVRRISLGGGLARAAWGGFMRVAKEIAEAGDFSGLKQAASGAELNRLFR